MLPWLRANKRLQRCVRTPTATTRLAGNAFANGVLGGAKAFPALLLLKAVWAARTRVAPHCVNTLMILHARKCWAFYPVSGEIAPRSAGKFWGICPASVKFSNLLSLYLFCTASTSHIYHLRCCDYNLTDALTDAPHTRNLTATWWAAAGRGACPCLHRCQRSHIDEGDRLL